MRSLRVATRNGDTLAVFKKAPDGALRWSGNVAQLTAERTALRNAKTLSEVKKTEGILDIATATRVVADGSTSAQAREGLGKLGRDTGGGTWQRVPGFPADDAVVITVHGEKQLWVRPGLQKYRDAYEEVFGSIPNNHDIDHIHNRARANVRDNKYVLVTALDSEVNRAWSYWEKMQTQRARLELNPKAWGDELIPDRGIWSDGLRPMDYTELMKLQGKLPGKKGADWWREAAKAAGIPVD